MKRVSIYVVLSLFFIFSFWSDNLKAQKTAGQIPPLQTISWLEGKWVKAYGDKLREEHWSFMGGSFLGMCREISDSSSSLIEIMVIEDEDGNTLLKIRRFTKGIKLALDEKDKTAVFKLSEYNKKEAFFVGIGINEGEAIRYKLLTKDLLEITFHSIQGGNKISEIYRMKRE